MLLSSNVGQEIDVCSSRGEKKHRGGFGRRVKYLRGVTHAACCQGRETAPAGPSWDGRLAANRWLLTLVLLQVLIGGWALRHTRSHAARRCQVTSGPPSSSGGHADGSPTMSDRIAVVELWTPSGCPCTPWLPRNKLAPEAQPSHSMTKGSSGDSANGIPAKARVGEPWAVVCTSGCTLSQSINQVKFEPSSLFAFGASITQLDRSGIDNAPKNRSPTPTIPRSDFRVLALEKSAAEGHNRRHIAAHFRTCATWPHCLSALS